MEQPYTPINCDFYDELEALSTLQRQIVIVWMHGAEEHTATARITNLYIRDKVEYMVLDTGVEIRLDALVSVDGKYPTMYC